MTAEAQAPRCPMCGQGIDPVEQSELCRSCPLYSLSESCRLNLVLCPACGYHALPDELEQVAADPAAAGQAGSPGHAGSPGRAADRTPGLQRPFVLSELRIGTPARVVEFDRLAESDLQRLLAYGVTPGARVRVLQRRPAFILRVQETELAVETSLARAIYVVPDRDDRP